MEVLWAVGEYDDTGDKMSDRIELQINGTFSIWFDSYADLQSFIGELHDCAYEIKEDNPGIE